MGVNIEMYMNYEWLQGVKYISLISTFISDVSHDLIPSPTPNLKPILCKSYGVIKKWNATISL